MPYKLQVNGTNTTKINGQLVKNLVYKGKIYNFDRPEQTGISRFKIVNVSDLLNTSYTNYLYIELTKTTTTALNIRVNGNHITTLTTAGYQKVSLCNISSGTYAVDTLVVELDGGEFIMGQCPSGSNFLFRQYTYDSGSNSTSAAEYSEIELGPNCIGSHNKISLWLERDEVNLNEETQITIGDGITNITSSTVTASSLLPCNVTIKDTNLVYDSRNNCNGIIHTETNTLIKGFTNTVLSDNNIQHIGENAFKSNTKLTAIQLPEGLQSIQSSAFSGCTSLTNINFNTDLQSIGSLAFKGTSALKTISISSVEDIQDQAFMNSGLETVYLPHNVKSIGTQVFANCPLKNIYVDKTNPYFTHGKHNDQLIDRTTKTLLCNISNTHIPQWIKHIGDYASQNNNQLQDLVLPAGLISIGKSAFAGSTLRSVILPVGLQSLGEDCLTNTKITSLTIPGTVKIAQGFQNCPRLTSLTLEEGIEEIGQLSKIAITELIIPDSVQRFSSVWNLTTAVDLRTIVIGRGLKKLESGCFASGDSNKRSLTEVTFRHTSDDELVIDANAFGAKIYKKAIEVTVYHYGNEAVLNYDWANSNITPTFVDLRENMESE